LIIVIEEQISFIEAVRNPFSLAFFRTASGRNQQKCFFSHVVNFKPPVVGASINVCFQNLRFKFDKFICNFESQNDFK
jgi:hypothetical protein